MYALMIFMFCFFLGSLAMFIYSSQKRENLGRALSDEHAQLRVLLRAMESRLDNMEKLLAIQTMPKDAANSAGTADHGSFVAVEHSQNQEPAGHDPLLHLSFEDPARKDKHMDGGLDLFIEEIDTVDTRKGDGM